MTPELKKLYKRRLREAKIIATLLAKLPFVRCVILNGSLAQSKIKSKSDIDLLIIAKSGRIFMARSLCLFVVWLSGKKRSSNEQKSHAGRFCLNYFLTSDFLIIPHNREKKINKYCAENYSQSVLLAGDEELFNKFMQKNWSWMKKYLGIQKLEFKSQNYNVKVKNNDKKRAFSEKMLGGKFGDNLEQWLKKIQLKRINCDPRTAKYPDLIMANDQEMRFHPPKERSKHGIINQK